MRVYDPSLTLILSERGKEKQKWSGGVEKRGHHQVCVDNLGEKEIVVDLRVDH